MSCSISRNPVTKKIEAVKAPNGNPSLLFDALRKAIPDTYTPFGYVKLAQDGLLASKKRDAVETISDPKIRLQQSKREWAAMMIARLYEDKNIPLRESVTQTDENGEPILEEYLRIFPDTFKPVEKKKPLEMLEVPDGYRKDPNEAEKNRIAQLNAQFNKDLTAYQNKTLPANHVFQLGKRSKFLKAAGFPDLPIEMSYQTFDSHINDHEITVPALYNLVNEIQLPMGVFHPNVRHPGSPLILTPLMENGHPVAVAIRLRAYNDKYLINSVRTIHLRDSPLKLKELFEEDKPLLLHKEKMLNWINGNLPVQQSSQGVSNRSTSPTLLTQAGSTNRSQRPNLGHTAQIITNIIKNFQNPKPLKENDFYYHLISYATPQEGIYRFLESRKLVTPFNGRWYVQQTLPQKREISISLRTNNTKEIEIQLAQMGIEQSQYSWKDTTNGIEVLIDKNVSFSSDKLIRNYEKVNYKALVEFLSSRFPSSRVEYITESEAATLLPNGLKNKTASFVKGNQVYLITNRLTDEIAIEEMLHPFVNALKSGNEKLYRKLTIQALEEFPQLRLEINSTYTNQKGFSEAERDMELVTQSLARYFQQEFETTPSSTLQELVAEFKNWFIQLFQDFQKLLYGEVYVIEAQSIHPNATLSDIVKLLHTTDTTFVTEPGSEIQYAQVAPVLPPLSTTDLKFTC